MVHQIVFSPLELNYVLYVLNNPADFLSVSGLLKTFDCSIIFSLLLHLSESPFQKDARWKALDQFDSSSVLESCNSDNISDLHQGVTYWQDYTVMI